MTAKIRRFCLAALLASMTAMASTAGYADAADDFPNRPITLIVPWTTGGATDVIMRAMAEAASKHIGQPIIVDNKAGGSGTVGPATMAATAKPDGYTIAQIPVGVFRLPLMQQVTYNAETDFTYIVHLTGYVFATFASAESGFKIWQDVVDYAKKNPGKVTYAHAGSGTSPHIYQEFLAAKAGIKLTPVPFKGGSEVNVAVAGNHTMLGASGTSAKPLQDAGKVKFLVVWTDKRIKIMPEVPILKEVGLPYVFDSPFGVAGPKGMDPRVVKKIHDAFKKALDEPAVIETMDKFESVPNYKNTEDYKAFVKEFIAFEKGALEQVGLLKK
jgi:tripartite-type tricarboxylate transporter receptor subunit TctC